MQRKTKTKKVGEIQLIRRQPASLLFFFATFAASRAISL
jgi:hypothetical protein